MIRIFKSKKNKNLGNELENYKKRYKLLDMKNEELRSQNRFLTEHLIETKRILDMHIESNNPTSSSLFELNGVSGRQASIKILNGLTKEFTICDEKIFDLQHKNFISELQCNIMQEYLNAMHKVCNAHEEKDSRIDLSQYYRVIDKLRLSTGSTDILQIIFMGDNILKMMLSSFGYIKNEDTNSGKDVYLLCQQTTKDMQS